MFSNRNLRTANVGDPEEIDLAYDITTGGVTVPVISSGKWTFARTATGIYRLTARALISQRAVKHIAHSGQIAVPVGTSASVRLVPVLDTWTQAGGFLDFRVVDSAGATIISDATVLGARIYLRVKQETTKVSQRG